MKKVIALFGIIGLCGFQVFAETREISNNNSFEESNGDVPAKWEVNDGIKNLGTIKILSESAQDGKNCLMIRTEKKQVFQFYGSLTLASPGDVIKMSAYVKGKGIFRLGVYMYNGKDVWLENIYPDAVAIKSEDWEKKDFALTLPDKEFGSRGKVAAIRPVILVDAGSEIYIDNFSGKIEEAAKPASPAETVGK